MMVMVFLLVCAETLRREMQKLLVGIKQKEKGEIASPFQNNTFKIVCFYISLQSFAAARQSTAHFLHSDILCFSHSDAHFSQISAHTLQMSFALSLSKVIN